MVDSLRYPDDRVLEYVQLEDGNGEMYMPDRQPSGNLMWDILEYCRAFLTLARRIAERDEKGEGNV